jgi:phosphoribosylanthranilate isomerase
MNYQIKICGVTDTASATQIAKLGVDFVGVIFAKSSPRKVTASQAKEIADAAKCSGAEPVAVFVEQTAHEIQTICAVTKINTVQLHGNAARQALAELPAELKKIVVIPVNEIGSITIDVASLLPQLNSQYDYLLFDNLERNTGKQIPLIDFVQFPPFKFFIAGGLNEKNIARILSLSKANGIDVSSSVETMPGIKDLKLIERLILATRGHHNAVL